MVHDDFSGSQPIFFIANHDEHPWFLIVKMDRNDGPNKPERHEFLRKMSNFLGNKLFCFTILAVDLPSHI